MTRRPDGPAPLALGSQFGVAVRLSGGPGGFGAHGARLARLARARRRLAQPAHEAVPRVVGMCDKMPRTAGAGGELQHARVEEAHQRPGARETQNRLVAVQLRMFEIEAVALHDRLDVLAAAVLAHEPVDVVEQRRMNVRLPRDEPVGGKRQHAFRRRDAFQLLVELDQAIARKTGFRLEQLQPGAELDQLDRQGDFADFRDYAFRRHVRRPESAQPI
ncbi:hypothetical protein BG61_27490 [Caballeronia glathei]|uniref:Uncharacterized protein n=1 Tax=Caballeronia glathei TaxID=60547 RepID=A0A069PS03_9BURK|nr:hypothetical protein BG61_27490 [Caballeronia glathei]